MEIRIGIRESGRDITLESSLDSKALVNAVNRGLADGTLELTDAKGRIFIVPSAAVAFVEIGSEDTRRVGFIS
jgi:hypothetical protein